MILSKLWFNVSYWVVFRGALYFIVVMIILKQPKHFLSFIKSGIKKKLDNTTNGKHIGVKVGDKVYDNNNPLGVNYHSWDMDLGITEQGMKKW